MKFSEAPKICAVIVENDPAAVKAIEPQVEFLEMRIDLIGEGWQTIAASLTKPWIATNRRAEEGGKWTQSESRRIDELEKALSLKAPFIDIELRTKDLEQILPRFAGKTRLLISYHELRGTPPLDEMKKIVRRQQALGADVCKIATTAQRFDDNLTILQLVSDVTDANLVAFAMGPLGLVSRILSPLAGGYFTFASIKEGRESAPGQVSVDSLKKMYAMMAGVHV
jgi:3-dehydroquinate dehydratase I